MPRGFSQIPLAEQQAVNYAIGLISSYTNPTIQYAGTGTADIEIAQCPAANPTSYAYYPGGDSAGGDVWFGTAYNYSAAPPGNYYFVTAMHELGHAFGLKHAQETGGVSNVAVPTAHDDLEYSVMSYLSYVGGPTTGYTNEAYGYSQTYMANDILALQTLYGANFTTHSENTVYSWDPTTGQEFINGVGQLAPGGGAADRPTASSDGLGRQRRRYLRHVELHDGGLDQSQSRCIVDHLDHAAGLSRKRPLRVRKCLQRLFVQ